VNQKSQQLWFALTLTKMRQLLKQPFNSPLSGTTQVSWYQKGKTNLDFTEARDSEWQWHHLAHMQVCTLLQTDNHVSTSPLSFLQAGCPTCHPTNSIKALKATEMTFESQAKNLKLHLAAAKYWSITISLGPSCRLPTASPGRWIGGRPPDMVASCDLSG